MPGKAAAQIKTESIPFQNLWDRRHKSITSGLKQGGKCIDERSIELTAIGSTMPNLPTWRIILLSYKKKNQLTGMLSLKSRKFICSCKKQLLLRKCKWEGEKKSGKIAAKH